MFAQSKLDPLLTWTCLMQARVSKASDVYALGVLVWEMCKQTRAFANLTWLEIHAAVVSKQGSRFQSLPADIQVSLAVLALRLAQHWSKTSNRFVWVRCKQTRAFVHLPWLKIHAAVTSTQDLRFQSLPANIQMSLHPGVYQLLPATWH